jgi:hypothetical protein
MFHKKYLVLALAVVAVAIAAGGAYAWWTSGGTGTGSATASSGGAGFTVAGDPANNIFPGGNSAVTSTVTNSDSSQKEYLTSLKVTISIDSTHATAGCLASWFTYKADADTGGTAANPYTVTAINTEIAASGHLDIAGKVFMSDTASTQDSCKGATVNLAYLAA